jgi:UDP-3-O-[3-hydroxymyristoyl] glucosamine N-acyltransferase
VTDVAPLHRAEAIELLNARCSGPDRPVTRLLDPLRALHEANGAVVVTPRIDPDAWTAWRAAGVAAVVVADDGEPASDDTSAAREDEGPALWRVDDPRLALARLSRRLDARPPVADRGVHPSALVDPTATLGARVAVGPMAVIGPRVRLGDDVVVGAGCVVAAGAAVGARTVLRERVVIGDGVRLGERCLVQAGAVLGSDGFGFALGPRGAERVHHLGGVTLGDDVEIGANACVDRGTLTDTVVGDRSKIDNLVQLAHNVRVGHDVLIAGQSGVAGSTTIGDGAVLGGAAGITDHVTVGAGARIGGGAVVTKDVPAGASWGGFPAQAVARWARERYLIGRLEDVWAYVRGHR